MNSRNALLFALVAAVAGMGAGFFFASVLGTARPTEAAAPMDPLQPGAAPRSAPAPTARLLDGGAQEAGRAPRVPSAEELRPRVSESEFRRALEVVDTPSIDAARGGGSITGQVFDAAGGPLDGVVVVGTRSSSSTATDPATVGAGPPLDQSLEEFLRQQAQSWARSRGQRQRVVTGPDGGFELNGLDEGVSYRMSAYLEDHIFETDGSSYSVFPGQKIIFRAQGVHVIPVQLVYEDGRAATEGIVGVKRGGSESYFKWSTASPHLRLTAGRVGVRGYAGVQTAERWRGGVDSTHGSEETSVNIAEAAGVPLSLVLKERRGIRGRVIDEPGVGGGWLTVRLLPVAPGADLDEEKLGDSDRTARLDGDRFHFLDLAPASYAIGLSSRSNVLLAHQIVTVGESVVEVELVVPEPDPNAQLVLHAFGPTGTPLHDLDLRWQHRHRGGSSSGSVPSRRAPDGGWLLHPDAEFFAPWPDETSYTLTVQHSELGDREIELEEGQREITVTFEEPVSIVAVVAGYAGSQYLDKLQVAVTPVVEGEDEPNWGRMMGGPWGRDEGKLSADGIARFDGLSPGLWEVSLHLETERWQTKKVQSVEVQVTSGEKTVSLDLPALYELTVIAPGLSKNSWLQLRPAGERGEGSFFDGGSSGRIDENGRAVFQGLVAGAYVLTGSGVHEPIDVTIPCGDLFIDAKEPDCLRVAIGDMEGALYQAGLRAGDLIVGTDGKDFAGEPDIWELMQGTGELSLLVDRDGRRLTLSMPKLPPGEDWFERLGGMLTPDFTE